MVNNLQETPERLKKLNKLMPILKIILAYFQVVGGLGFLVSPRFPPIYSKVVSIVGGFVPLDFGEIGWGVKRQADNVSVSCNHRKNSNPLSQHISHLLLSSQSLSSLSVA